jgi:hypothetical protein
MLACAYEIHVDVRPEKYVSTSSDGQAALKALQAAKTTSQLVQQCQKPMNDISTQHSVGLFRVPDILGHMEMKLPMRSQGRELFTSLLDWNQRWGGFMAEYKKKITILDAQPAYGNVAGSQQYSETGSKIDFGSSSHC